MVYVVANDGQPLMPTERHGKVCRMLKSGMAKVVKKCPFTIQLQYESERNVQPVALGIDAGSKHVGVSATTKAKVLYESDVELRDDIVKLLATRRQLRRRRRSRKTRYRPARFDNRRRKEGWLAPSIRQKIESHLTVVANVCKILPVSQIIVETASFDIQKIKNPDIQGIEYQQGEQMDFWNIREYVLFRDGHTCQCCKGKSKDKVLNVHHIESRKTGGNAPNNLITLCETCHKGYHNGTVTLPKNIKRGMKFKDAAFMGIMRWTFYNTLKEQYEPDIPVHYTYGYITKNTRINHNLLKGHCIDARCISGNPDAVSDGTYYYQKKVRCHNRQIHKQTILKGGIRKSNQAEYLVRGFRLFDKVRYQGREYFIFGRRKSGFFDIRTLSGEKISSVVCSDDVHLDKFMEEKTVLFVNSKKIDVSSKTTDLSGLLYHQMCSIAENNAINHIPFTYRVTLLIDDITCYEDIPYFVYWIEYGKGYGISITATLQSLEQLNCAYEETCLAILEHIDKLVFLSDDFLLCFDKQLSKYLEFKYGNGFLSELEDMTKEEIMVCITDKAYKILQRKENLWQ